MGVGALERNREKARMGEGFKGKGRRGKKQNHIMTEYELAHAQSGRRAMNEDSSPRLLQ